MNNTLSKLFLRKNIPKFNKFLPISNKNFSSLNSTDIKLFNNRNEIKLNFNNKTYSVFFTETDTIGSIKEKIRSISNEISTIEIFSEDKGEKSPDNSSYVQKENSDETNFSLIAKDAYLININKTKNSIFIPTLYTQLYNSDAKSYVGEFNPLWEYSEDVEDMKNEIIFHLYKLKTNNTPEKFNEISKNFINEIKNSLNNRRNSFLEIQKTQKLSFDAYNKFLNKRIRNFNSLGLSFAFGNFLGFYLLIYKFYAWDVIEPVTYIVGNFYWIVSLGYLVFTNRKLDFDLLEKKSVKEIYSDKIAMKFNYNEKEKALVENEIEKIDELKNAINELHPDIKV